jgi:hypothetical protein
MVVVSGKSVGGLYVVTLPTSVVVKISEAPALVPMVIL